MSRTGSTTALLVLSGLVLLGADAAPAAAQNTDAFGTQLREDRAAAPEILSDRPGLGDGAHVLAEGVWQLEVGGQFLGSDVRRYSLGQGLLRVGLSPVELRVYGNSLVVDGGTGSDLGLEDLGLGAKVRLGEAGSWRWSALGLMTFPTGTADFSARETTAGVSLIGETALTDAIGLALNAGYFFPVAGLDDGSFAVIVTPGFGIPGVAGLSGYAGVASYLGHGADQNYIEAGLAYLRHADLQLDLNWGVETDSRDWFVGVGLARRWR